MGALHALGLLAACLPHEGERYSYFDSRETPSGPRLELELSDGTTRTLAAQADTVLLEYLPERVLATHAQLSVDQGDRNRVLVRFELPSTLAVERARLRLTVHPSEPLPPRVPFEVSCHALLESWEERGATWQRQPAFDAAPCAELLLAPEGGELVVDLTAVVRAWASGERASHGLLLHAAQPVLAPEEVDAELLALYRFETSLDAARERARRERRDVLVLVAGTFGKEGLTEHERLLLATVLSHPGVRAEIERRFVPVRVRVSPGLVAASFEPGSTGANPLAALGVELREAKPPALLIAGADGTVRAKQVGFALCDPWRVLAWLGADAQPEAGAQRAAFELLRSGKLAEAEAALAALERDAEALYWSAALADARGDPATRALRLARLERSAEEPRWALKARVRRALPDLVCANESVWSVAPPRDEAGLVRHALALLLRFQLPDGSFPMGEPVFEEHREGITALCALALLVHGESGASARAHAWLRARLADRPARELNSFTATYWLDLALERLQRGAPREEVTAAIALLAGGQLENGAWSYSRAFGEGWRGGFSGWPATERGRVHSMNTAIALEVLTRAAQQGFAVERAVLERGRDALLAMRSGPGVYTYTWPEPVNFDRLDASIGRAPAAELALLRLEAVPRKDLETSLAEFVARRSTLHVPVQLSDSWLPPHGLSGYFHSFAYFHAARAFAELPAAARRRPLRELRADVLARVEADGSWLDTFTLGKPYATAMALLVLWLTQP